MKKKIIILIKLLYFNKYLVKINFNKQCHLLYKSNKIASANGTKFLDELIKLYYSKNKIKK